MERLHIQVKRIADPIDNTRCYERSVLSALLSSYRAAETIDALGEDAEVPAEFPFARASQRACVHGVMFEAHDILHVHANSFARIMTAAAEQGEYFFICERLVKVRQLTQHSGVARCTGDAIVHTERSVHHARAWYRISDMDYVVLC